MNALELEQLRGDRRTKQAIVYTICGITMLFSVTVCVLVLRGLAIPEALDRLITFVVGNITGMLTKTGVERAMTPPQEPVEVTTPPGQPLETTDVPPDGGGEEEETNPPLLRRVAPLSKVQEPKP